MCHYCANHDTIRSRAKVFLPVPPWHWGNDPRVLFSALHNITKRIELGASQMLCEILHNSPSVLGYNIAERISHSDAIAWFQPLWWFCEIGGGALVNKLK